VVAFFCSCKRNVPTTLTIKIQSETTKPYSINSTATGVYPLLQSKAHVKTWTQGKGKLAAINRFTQRHIKKTFDNATEYHRIAVLLHKINHPDIQTPYLGVTYKQIIRKRPYFALTMDYATEVTFTTGSWDAYHNGKRVVVALTKKGKEQEDKALRKHYMALGNWMARQIGKSKGLQVKDVSVDTLERSHKPITLTNKTMTFQPGRTTIKMTFTY
jgi:hypothetical protein